jgi:hypothetical protein
VPEQIPQALAFLDRLTARGRQIAGRLQTTPDSAVDIRAWQQDVAMAVNELSGGSKAHWLSRAFSQAFLVSPIPGEIVTEASPADIVERLLVVLAQARASLATMDPLDAAAAATAPSPAVRRFDFVQNAELRPVLEQAYAESAGAFDAKDFQRAFLTSCSILEAIITDALEGRGARIERRVQEMTFNERIAAAEAAGLIRGGCARLPSTARTYRDLQSDTMLSERDARTVRQVLNVVMRDLDPGR